MRFLCGCDGDLLQQRAAPKTAEEGLRDLFVQAGGAGSSGALSSQLLGAGFLGLGDAGSVCCPTASDCAHIMSAPHATDVCTHFPAEI